MYKKISVVGGSGFVGTHLCQQLSEKQVEFEIIDIKPSRQFPNKWRFGDVRSIESLRETVTGDIIVLLAAVHRDDIPNKNEYHRTNVEGAENIVKVCEEKGIKKIVFTSTVAVYGFAKAGTDENGPVDPFNTYGKTKFLAEEKLRSWQKSKGKQLIIVRPTVIFGKGNRGNVYNLFNKIANNKFVMIGSGKNKKSIAYIANVVAFLECCLSTKRDFAIYNYVDTPDLDMNALVSTVKSYLKGDGEIRFRIPFWLGLVFGYLADILSLALSKNFTLSSIRVRKFCATTSFSSSKLDLEGFQPPFELKAAIEQTLQSEFLSPDLDMEIFYSE